MTLPIMHAPKRWKRSAVLRALLLASSVPIALPAAAQDATWLANPGTGDFNTAANWTPATVPTGTAFFGTSSTTALSFSADTTVGGFTFNAGASNYTFSLVPPQTLDFTGSGIVLNGGSAAITSRGIIQFFNSSTAGSAAITSNGIIRFFNSSTAGSATVTNNGAGFIDFADTSTAGSAAITSNGIIRFFNSSTAGSATFTNNGAIFFVFNSTAGSATFTNNGGGEIEFSNAASAGTATFTNNGTIFFLATSTGGAARFINGASGVIDLSGLASTGITSGRQHLFGREELGGGRQQPVDDVFGCSAGRGRAAVPAARSPRPAPAR